jgi:mRNA interferase MazF
MAEPRRTRKTQSHDGPKRGEIYLTALDPALGRETKKTRPALVVQNDTSNRYGAVVMVAPITPAVRLPLSPLHVLLPADSATGLKFSSVAVVNQIRAVDRRRLIKKLGSVDAWVLEQVDGAIEAALGLALSRLQSDRKSPPVITEAISKSTGDFKTGRFER